jgi:HK97 family phage major capsid protein
MQDDMLNELIDRAQGCGNSAHELRDLENTFQEWLGKKTGELGRLLDGRPESELKADEARRYAAISGAIAKASISLNAMHARHAEGRANKTRLAGTATAPSGESRGFTLPSMSEYERRGQRIGVDTDGGFWVTSEVGPMVDRLRPSSIIFQAGARVFPMKSDALELPKLHESTTVYAVGEISTVTPSQIVTGRIRLSARAYAARTVASSDWMADANPEPRELLAADMSKQLALKFDVDCLQGDGTSTSPIVGLRNMSDITQTEVASGSGNGGLPALNDIINAIDRLERDNATPSFIAMHPRTWGTFRKLDDQQDRLMLTPDPSQDAARRLFGLPVLLSSQISITETQGNQSDCSYIIVGDGSQLAVGLRAENSVIYDPFSYASSRQVQIVLHSRLAFNVLNVEAVEVIKGVRTS